MTGIVVVVIVAEIKKRCITVANEISVLAADVCGEMCGSN